MRLPFRPRPVLIALVVAGTWAIAGVASSAAASPTPVLGTRYFYAPDASGFGRAHPSLFSNGGDPSGVVSDIHWSSWGGPVAVGVGQNAIFMPAGGYYPGTVPIQLRASHLGDCGDGVRAYLTLEFSVPSKPGGPAGPWTTWGTAKTFCPEWSTTVSSSTNDLAAAGSEFCALRAVAQAAHAETVRTAVTDGINSLLFALAAKSSVRATRSQAQAVVTVDGRFSADGHPVGIHDRVAAGTRVSYQIVCSE
jgi:hypothetical protein